MHVVKPDRSEQPFQPFDLTIRVETREEAEKLHHAFNYSPLVQYLCSSPEAEGIRKYIEKNTPIEGGPLNPLSDHIKKYYNIK